MPVRTTEGWSARENTMSSGISRSAAISIQRLRRRYVGIDFERCAAEICSFLSSNGTQDRFDPYRVAERAVYPGFGVCSNEYLLEKTLYFWMAANDESQQMISSVSDRRNCFVRALRESQRGNNAAGSESNSASINYVDNRAERDINICSIGTTNKLAEVFVGMHPDIELVIFLKDSMTALARGFIAEYLYSVGNNYNNLISADLNLSNLLPTAEVQRIKNKIIERYGIASELDTGLITESDLEFLNLLLGDSLEYLTFIVSINEVRTCLTESKVNELIIDANRQLERARRENSARRHEMSNMRTSAGAPVFDSSAISRIFRDNLPALNDSVRTPTTRFTAPTQTIRPERAIAPVTYTRPVITQATLAGDSVTSDWVRNYLSSWSRPNHNPILGGTLPPVLTQEHFDAAMGPQSYFIPIQVETNVRTARRVATGRRPNGPA